MEDVNLEWKALYLIWGKEVNNKFDTPESIEFIINILREGMWDVVTCILSNFVLWIENVGLHLDCEKTDSNNNVIPYVTALTQPLQVWDSFDLEITDDMIKKSFN